MARPKDARGIKRIKSAALCWQHWHVDHLTAHDGQFAGNHPVIVRAIERVQSATSLQQLLRDPLGFVWRYALRWTAPQERELPLSIAPDELGKLVHELLRRAVDCLEPNPGYAKASEAQIEEALRTAATHLLETWPLERPVPPKLLWSNTVDYAATMALVGLLRKEIAEEGTRSWTECPLGSRRSSKRVANCLGMQQCALPCPTRRFAYAERSIDWICGKIRSPSVSLTTRQASSLETLHR
jgi:hypothetical protein